MPYQYTYLIWNGIFFFLWLGALLSRKDLWRELISVSILLGLGGLFAEYIATEDYWHPVTITNSRIGIESFLVGFFIGGVGAVIYEVISGNRLSARSKPHASILRALQLVGLLGALTLGGFYLLGINSLYATIIGFVIPSALMLLRRKDLIWNAFATGFLLMVVGVLIYLVLQVLQPGFIQAFWVLNGAWYTKLILGIPLGEYVFYFLAGVFIGPLYEYVRGYRLIRI